MVSGKNPYHMPIVRILRVSVRKGQNNPLCMFCLAVYVLFFSLDTVIKITSAVCGKCTSIKRVVAICKQSV